MDECFEGDVSAHCAMRPVPRGQRYYDTHDELPAYVGGKPWQQLSYTDLENLGTPAAKKRMQKIDKELDDHFPEFKIAKKWFMPSVDTPLPKKDSFVGDQIHASQALTLLRNTYMMHGNVPDLSHASTGIHHLETYADVLASHQAAVKNFGGNDKQMKDEFHRQMRMRGHENVHWIESTNGAAVVRLPNKEHVVSVHGTTSWINKDGTMSKHARDNFRNATTNFFGVDVSDHDVSKNANKLIAKHKAKTAISYSKGSYEASFMNVDHHVSFDGHLPTTNIKAKKTTVVGTTRSLLPNLRGARSYVNNVFTLNPKPTMKSGLFKYIKDAHSLRHFAGTSMHMNPNHILQNLTKTAGDAEMIHDMRKAIQNKQSFSEWLKGFGGHNDVSDYWKDGLGRPRINHNSPETDLWEQLGGTLTTDEKTMGNRATTASATKTPERANPHLVNQFKNAPNEAAGQAIVEHHTKVVHDYANFLTEHGQQAENAAHAQNTRIKGGHMKYGTTLHTLIGFAGQMGLDPTIGAFLRKHNVPEPVIQGLENGATTAAVTKWLEESRGLVLPGGATMAGLTSGIGALMGSAMGNAVYKAARKAHLSPVAAQTVTGAIVGGTSAAASSATKVAANALKGLGSEIGNVTSAIARGEAPTAEILGGAARNIASGTMDAVRGVEVGSAVAEGAMNILGGAAMLAVQALVTSWTNQQSAEVTDLMGEQLSTAAKARQLNEYFNSWGEDMVREGLRDQTWLTHLKQNPMFSTETKHGSFFDAGFGYGHTQLLTGGKDGPVQLRDAAEQQAYNMYEKKVTPAIRIINQLKSQQLDYFESSGMQAQQKAGLSPAGDAHLWQTYYSTHLNPLLYENYVRQQMNNSFMSALTAPGAHNIADNEQLSATYQAMENSLPKIGLLPGQNQDGTFGKNHALPTLKTTTTPATPTPSTNPTPSTTNTQTPQEAAIAMTSIGGVTGPNQGI